MLLTDMLLAARLARAEVVAALAAALGTLGERDRLFLALCYREGLTTREIGQVLDLPDASVHQRHRETLERLCAALPAPVGSVFRRLYGVGVGDGAQRASGAVA